MIVAQQPFFLRASPGIGLPWRGQVELIMRQLPVDSLYTTSFYRSILCRKYLNLNNFHILAFNLRIRTCSRPV